MLARCFSPLTRFFVVTLCVVSWLLASNHCALAAYSQSATKHDCCESGADKKAPEKQHVECCQVLQPVQQAIAKAPVAPQPVLLSEPLLFAECLLPDLVEETHSCLQMTDPPPVAWFTSIDLQRCHRASAPPLFS